MHYWGDDWEYWDDFYEMEEYFAKLIRKYRLPAIQIKEKYGSLRCYMAGLGYDSLHSITHPGHAFSRYPDWLWKINCRYLMSSNIFWRWLVYWPSEFINSKLYRGAYKKTIKKYPHLRDEILYMADYEELLEGL